MKYYTEQKFYDALNYLAKTKEYRIILVMSVEDSPIQGGFTMAVLKLGQETKELVLYMHKEDFDNNHQLAAGE